MEPTAEPQAGPEAHGAGAQPGVSPGLHPLRIFRLLRLAGGALLDHLFAFAELARLEWQEERARLQEMIFATIIAIVCLMFGLLYATVFVMVAVWDTPYRLHVAGALALLFGGVSFLTWRRVKQMAEGSETRFSLLSAEVAETLALLRKHL